MSQELSKELEGLGNLFTGLIEKQAKNPSHTIEEIKATLDGIDVADKGAVLGVDTSEVKKKLVAILEEEFKRLSELLS